MINERIHATPLQTFHVEQEATQRWSRESGPHVLSRRALGHALHHMEVQWLESMPRFTATVPNFASSRG
ncbi:hypothetical protein D7Y11_22585 [Corallococcus sp. AB018]|nr:hypothetical protein D7Y11_22585 [Corallococcus sp. AB018]